MSTNNHKEVTLQQMLHDDNMGKIVGCWGKLGYVTEDDLDTRKVVEIHAGHVGAFLALLHLKRSFDDIETYDSLGTSVKNES